jgi:hypothetical protein
MPVFIADGAGKRKTNASKAVSTRVFETSEKERKVVLVCPVAGVRRTEV